MKTDYLIIGSGLTGSTMARQLADAGKSVHVLERRSVVGGNAYDTVHPSGIRYNLYGAHYFRTNSKKIWDYVNRFAEFYPFEGKVMSLVDGNLEHWPIQQEYIWRNIGPWKPEFSGKANTFEDACLAMMPRPIYEKFVKGYTEKQWGVPCTKLSPSLAGRFEIRTNFDTRLKQDKYQGLPLRGYTSLVQSMLRYIPVTLNCDYLKYHDEFKAKFIIFTGAIDEYYGFDLGKLKYRSQRRENFYLSQKSYQDCMAVNYPDKDNPILRTFEWKKMMYAENSVMGTLVTQEFPMTPSDPDKYEYPFPDEENKQLYRKYADRNHGNVMFAGRLGEYKYYDMDQAIARALVLSEKVLKNI